MTLYTAKSYDHLLGTPGFSDALLNNHFELYKGYVKSTSQLHEELQAGRREGKTSAPQLAELRRRFGWEFDGMRLHELYFENMTRRLENMTGRKTIRLQTEKDFGSFESWSEDFKTTGRMRGIGWAAVVWDSVAQRLFDTWIDEHHVGHLAGCPILLVMDVFEHAFTLDYGIKKADYIEAFFTAIDWGVVESRFEAASRLGGRESALVAPNG